MRVLVIGATGYLGTHVTRALVKAGHQVSGISRSEKGDGGIVAAGAAPVRGDLSRIETVIAAAQEHDAVIYTAQLMLQAEFDAIAALLGALGPDRHFLFTSGTGLLSQRTDGAWSEDSFAEDDPFIPSKYIGFRHVTETMVRQAGTSGATRAMVVRPPMIWGNGGSGHLRLFYHDALTRGEVGYLGEGLNMYSHVHVEDLAQIYCLALDRGIPGALYHAVAGELNNRTLAEAVARDVGTPVRSVDFTEALNRWGKFETLIAMAVSSRSRSPRARRELGWTPQHRDILADIGHPAYRQTGKASLPGAA